jgi:hypothetical protein
MLNYIEIEATTVETILTNQPPDPALSTAATFEFTSNKTGPSFECQLDGSAYAACVSPKTYTGLSVANHTFAVRASKGGNTDLTPASYTWSILPSVSISGSAGVAGAILTYTGGSTNADGSGNYAFPVASGWTGTITPFRFGYTFTPASITISTPVTADLVNQDFTATATPGCTWSSYTPPAAPTFGDVPVTVGHWSWVERLANATITAGCGAGNYCPFNEVNRAQMAIFLLRGTHCGNSYAPPAVGGSSGFGDVPLDATYAPWVKQLAAEGITAGCGNGNFCPLQVVTRAQMAIFLLRARHGATYTPPPVGGSTGFADVPLDASYAPWVKQLAAEGITAGCGGGNFCPLQNVNRAQMATFLVRAFELP